jgi:hypothetical protein
MKGGICRKPGGYPKIAPCTTPILSYPGFAVRVTTQKRWTNTAFFECTMILLLEMNGIWRRRCHARAYKMFTTITI